MSIEGHLACERVKWCDERYDCDQDRAPDQPHGHLGEGRLPGSLAERQDAHQHSVARECAARPRLRRRLRAVKSQSWLWMMPVTTKSVSAGRPNTVTTSPRCNSPRILALMPRSRNVTSLPSVIRTTIVAPASDSMRPWMRWGRTKGASASAGVPSGG